MSKDEMSRAEYDRIGKDIVYFPDRPPLDYAPEVREDIRVRAWLFEQWQALCERFMP